MHRAVAVSPSGPAKMRLAIRDAAVLSILLPVRARKNCVSVREPIGLVLHCAEGAYLAEKLVLQHCQAVVL